MPRTGDTRNAYTFSLGNPFTVATMVEKAGKNKMTIIQRIS
jgi:hypothetical protein